MLRFLLIVILLVILLPLAFQALFTVWFTLAVFPELIDVMLETFKNVTN
jgi:hypothetical protein